MCAGGESYKDAGGNYLPLCVAVQGVVLTIHVVCVSLSLLPGSFRCSFAGGPNTAHEASCD